MSTLLRRSSRRELLRHPWQVALSVIGVGLGVAVFVGIEIANAGALRAFELSTTALAGRATHHVIGGPGGIDESVFAELMAADGTVVATPIIEASITVESAPGRTFTLLGVDLFSAARFFPFLEPAAGPGSLDLTAFLTEPGALLFADSTLSELGLAVGDGLTLRTPMGPRDAFVAGELTASADLDRQALADIVVADLATAQELLRSFGAVSRIELQLGRDASDLEQLRATVPANLVVEPVGSRAGTAAAMTGAFRLNLRALSLLALICGGFLVYNTMAFSVVRRRESLGIQRAIGVRRREILRAVLGEALVIGVLGAGLGLVGGALLSRHLLELMGRTINDLYFALRVTEAPIDGVSLAVGALVGVGAAVLAALSPAWEATSAPTRVALSRTAIESDRLEGAPRFARIGLTLLFFGAALLAFSGTSLTLSFAGLLCIVVGFALTVPWITALVSRASRPLLGRPFGLVGRMVAGGVGRSLSRTSVAIASLTVAVSVTVGIGAMIGSFRTAVVQWLEATLAADLYVGSQSTLPARFDEGWVDRVRGLPGVDRVNLLRTEKGRSSEGTANLLAFDLDERGRKAFILRSGEADYAWPALASRDAVLVSEPYASRNALETGDSVELVTASGPVRFEIVGIYQDYGSDLGAVLFDHRTFERRFGEGSWSALSIYVQPGVEPEALLEPVRSLAASAGLDLTVRSTRSLRQLSLEIFDRTFVITRVLRLLAGLVAAIAVASALAALELERTREIGMLRAVGFTPKQVRRLIAGETGLMGLIAGVLALPLGLILAAAMVYVINERAFGWSMELTVEPSVLIQALALALGAALVAGVIPGFRASRTPPTAALRNE